MPTPKLPALTEAQFQRQVVQLARTIAAAG